jgi:hypothetical protein
MRISRLSWWQVAGFGAAMTAAIAVVLAPWLPRAPDLYVHLVWGWEVMRCAAEQQLPLWLPDLNAGFGSPGIRLYNPLGPVVSGSLGLALGDAGRGLRAAALLAAAGVLWVARRRTASHQARVGMAVLISPMVLFSLFGRAAWSEFLSIPLMWWLLVGLAKGELTAVRDGVMLALLWLLHAPTTIMIGCLGAVSLVIHGSRDYTLRALRTVAVALGLTAWHWMPLLSETAAIDAGVVLTGGIFEPTRNLLGSASAHAPHLNSWLGWVAIGLLASVVVTRLWASHPRRAGLAVGCILLASPIALPLWWIPGPHQLLQFPWRWLLPATLLLVTAISEAPTRRVVGAMCILAPVLLMPWAPAARVPTLDTSLEWGEAGKRLFESIGANPLLVDAAQNRPSAFDQLGQNLRLFGPSQLVAVAGDGEVSGIRRWSPLRREVEVVGREPFTIAFRILEYPFWAITTDDSQTVQLGGAAGVIACQLPAGRHIVRVSWVGNPAASVGQIMTLLTVGVLFFWHRRRVRPKP